MVHWQIGTCRKPAPQKDEEKKLIFTRRLTSFGNFRALIVDVLFRVFRNRTHRNHDGRIPLFAERRRPERCRTVPDICWNWAVCCRSLPTETARRGRRRFSEIRRWRPRASSRSIRGSRSRCGTVGRRRTAVASARRPGACGCAPTARSERTRQKWHPSTSTIPTVCYQYDKRSTNETVTPWL